MKHAILLPITFLLLVYGCAKKQEEEKKVTTEKFCLTAALKEKVSIETVQMQAVTESFSLTGNVAYNADDVVQFSSLVNGLITNTFFSLGDYVKKGQVLAEIKSTELNSLQAERKSLQSQLLVAKRKLQATKSMYENEIASQSDLISGQSEVDVLKSSIENVEQNLALYSASSEKSVFQIKAPVSGYIVSKSMSPGTQINDNDGPLFTISNLSEVWVMVNIYSMNLNDVHEGMDVKITTPAYPNQVFDGKIAKLSQVFETDEHVLKARIVMNNSNLKLKPGLTADVLINKKVAQKEMVAVPAKALIFDNNKNYILVYKDDCHLERRLINPTVKNKDFIYFESGLEVGEKVIVKNHLLISEQLKDNELRSTNKN
ncbi:efflux RND transporter periplasmic adaptor subunit [Flavobacterium seoulense]|uniref:RND transporter n=1 Tax=Flavobacterium seoulense TaxID=1492738 RepID=A0A066WU19_9FLAO|nr:efflux RND transporter periplasmic adaptor subunit [Flavobacterium seoulense]KDN54175.1 RND transporter [Flavobacterium seoulense]